MAALQSSSISSISWDQQIDILLQEVQRPILISHGTRNLLYREYDRIWTCGSRNINTLFLPWRWHLALQTAISLCSVKSYITSYIVSFIGLSFHWMYSS